jgi:hypothetical protein
MSPTTFSLVAYHSRPSLNRYADENFAGLGLAIFVRGHNSETVAQTGLKQKLSCVAYAPTVSYQRQQTAPASSRKVMAILVGLKMCYNAKIYI